jgi:hypothetical protein
MPIAQELSYCLPLVYCQTAYCQAVFVLHQTLAERVMVHQRHPRLVPQWVQLAPELSLVAQR